MNTHKYKYIYIYIYLKCWFVGQPAILQNKFECSTNAPSNARRMPPRMPPRMLALMLALMLAFIEHLYLIYKNGGCPTKPTF